jgi:hypothetical protein
MEGARESLPRFLAGTLPPRQIRNINVWKGKNRLKQPWPQKTAYIIRRTCCRLWTSRNSRNTDPPEKQLRIHIGENPTDNPIARSQAATFTATIFGVPSS